MINENDKRYENTEEDNLINKNAGEGYDSKRAVADPDRNNVDPLKPQFERNNLQANQEKRAGSGGSDMDAGKREDRQNNGDN